MTGDRTARVRQALAVLRDIAWPGWTPCRSAPTPPWEDEKYVSRLGYVRVAAAFVDAGWTPPNEPPTDIGDWGWLHNILHGIDTNECEDDHGWWPTSTGAAFGAERLAELKTAIIERYVAP